MGIEIVDSFVAGNVVPDWLLGVEGRPGIPRPTLIFAVDCHVIKTSAGYMIVPDMMIARPPVDCLNAPVGANLTAIATSDPVSIALGWVTVGANKPPRDDGKDASPTPPDGGFLAKILTPSFGGKK